VDPLGANDPRSGLVGVVGLGKLESLGVLIVVIEMSLLPVTETKQVRLMHAHSSL
jgi:hypothetical protein